LVPCPNVVLSSREFSAHAFGALDSCRHAGEGLPCCPVTSSRASGAANGRAGEEYQVKARYQVRANPLLWTNQPAVPFGGEHSQFEWGWRAVGLCSPCLWWWGRLCRWGLCPRCPGVGRCLSEMYKSSEGLSRSRLAQVVGLTRRVYRLLISFMAS